MLIQPKVIGIFCPDFFTNKILMLIFSTVENDSSLHTQLWIDPTEEFLQYTHTGDPVDVTFGVKELKVL
jgi:hypothetical protein